MTTRTVPRYLADRAADYQRDPRAAAVAWFSAARFGLFLHYGLYSLLGRHEWVQLRERIPVAEYAKLADRFTAENFDAAAICDLALAAEMRYVNITTRHHDSFCLFRTAQTGFNTVATACGRDLVGELAAACAERGLGLCLYYSHGRDWRHPHAPGPEAYDRSARPAYDPPEPSYAYGDDHDLDRYLEFMAAQITELLTNYGPVAAIWLDGIATPLAGDADAFRCQELYDLVHDLQPQCLVSYKQGLTGTEDFFAPEHGVPGPGDDEKRRGRIGTGAPIEVCTTLIQDEVDGRTVRSWGHHESWRHKGPEGAWEDLRRAGAAGANLLLNTGPLPDGRIDPRDEATLRAIGERIRAEGYPS